MAELIEKWVSCELPTDNEELKSLVEEVNVHHHTHSCHKKGLECRFDFPKLMAWNKMDFKQGTTFLNPYTDPYFDKFMKQKRQNILHVFEFCKN